MQILNQIQSLPPVKLTDCTRSSVRDYFLNTWELYEWLFSSIRSDDSLFINPDPRRHPLIFYLGHTAVFYLNKFKAAGIVARGINEEYENILAVGVDPATAKDLETRDLWPSADAVRDYRVQAREKILEVIERADFSGRITWDHPLWSLFMGLEHDRIHFETSSVLIRQYPADLVQAPQGWKTAPLDAPLEEISMVELEGGKVTLGRPHTSDLYGWDNEYGTEEFDVAPFAVSRNMVSNADFLAFVEEGGYQRSEFWTEEGWTWKEKYGMLRPRFWIPSEDGYQYRAMFQEFELPMSWPAEVTCHEARAFCAWKGSQYRLMWEREWKFLSNQAPHNQGDVVFGNNYNLNLHYHSPSPVGMMTAGQTSSGVNDIHGNVWDWLNDDFYRLRGFRIHDYYKDFSDPYFDSQHGMLAGGAWASTGTGASKYYRLWFRRGFIQHAGFRLAQDI